MAKRKTPVDWSLNDIIGEHLKSTKCEKSLKAFEVKVGLAKKPKMMKKFLNYLKEKEAEKENTKDEDLGFEINFGAYQPDKKVSIIQIIFYHLSYFVSKLYLRNFLTSVFQLPFTELNRSKKQEKKEHKIDGGIKKRKEVPKEFIEKIQKLGMKVENAEVLYASKIEWAAVYSENTIYCTEPSCDFNTKIDNGILTKHMIDRHNWGEYPCNHAHCNFVGYSKVRNLFH